MPSAVERKELQQFPVVREVKFLSGFHTWFFSWRWEICKCVQQADGCVGASTNNF